MIDREPDLAAARAAASSALADSELGSAPDPVSSSAPASGSAPSGSSATAPTSDTQRAALAAARGQLIRMGAMGVLALSCMAAERWGAHWVYTEQECLTVSEATLDVAEYYFGGFDHPLFKLGLVLGVTAVPRLIGPKLPPLQRETPAAAAPAPGPGQPASSSTGQPAPPAPAAAPEELRAAA